MIIRAKAVKPLLVSIVRCKWTERLEILQRLFISRFVLSRSACVVPVTRPRHLDLLGVPVSTKEEDVCARSNRLSVNRSCGRALSNKGLPLLTKRGRVNTLRQSLALGIRLCYVSPATAKADAPQLAAKVVTTLQLVS